MIIDELVGDEVGHLFSVVDVYVRDLEQSCLYQSRPVVLEGARRKGSYEAIPGTHDDFHSDYSAKVREASADPSAFRAKYGHRLWVQTTGVTDVRNIRGEAIQTYSGLAPHSFLITNPANPELRLHTSSLRPEHVVKVTGNRRELIGAVTARRIFWSEQGNNIPKEPAMASELLEHYGDRDGPLYGISWELETYGRGGSFYAAFIGEKDLKNVVKQLRVDPGVLVKTVNFHFPYIITEGIVRGELQPPREFGESMDELSHKFAWYAYQRDLIESLEKDKLQEQLQVRAPSRKKRWFIF